MISLNKHYFNWHIQRVFKLTSLAEDKFTPDLILWPESTLINKTPLTKDFLEFQTFIKTIEADLILGSKYIDKINEKTYNAAYHYSQGFLKNLSFKTKLVPFFETDIDSPSTKKKVFVNVKKHLTIGPLLCFELLFSSTSKQLVKDGATTLICLSNNSYLGKSNWPILHASYGVFRSVETGTPLIFANNTGFSIISTHLGQITHILSLL